MVYCVAEYAPKIGSALFRLDANASSSNGGGIGPWKGVAIGVLGMLLIYTGALLLDKHLKKREDEIYRAETDNNHLIDDDTVEQKIEDAKNFACGVLDNNF